MLLNNGSSIDGRAATHLWCMGETHRVFCSRKRVSLGQTTGNFAREIRFQGIQNPRPGYSTQTGCLTLKPLLFAQIPQNKKKKIVFCETNFKKLFYKIKMIWKTFHEQFYLSRFVHIVTYMYIYIYSVCWNIYEKKSRIFGYFGFRKKLLFMLLICNIV